MNPADRVRERLKVWLDTTGLGQRQLAIDLDKSQVWLQKVLAGENHIRLRDLDQIAGALRTTAAELVRAEDDRYQLELTPTEVRIVETLRHRPDARDAIASLLKLTDAHKPAPVAKPEPTPTVLKQHIGKRPKA